MGSLALLGDQHGWSVVLLGRAWSGLGQACVHLGSFGWSWAILDGLEAVLGLFGSGLG